MSFDPNYPADPSEEPIRDAGSRDSTSLDSQQPADAGELIDQSGKNEVDAKSTVDIGDADAEVIVAQLDRQQLEWLHPTSLMFDAIAHVRALIVPVTIGLFSAAQGSFAGVMFAVLIFVPALLTSIFKYLTLRYTILDDKLVVMRGLIFRRVRTVPVQKIQNIDLIQNPLHRILGVAEVRIETASGTEPEAILRVLSLDQVERLRAGVSSRKQQAVSASVPAAAPSFDGMPTATHAMETVATDMVEEKTLLEVPTSWLVRAGLASNRGVLIIGVAWGAMYEFNLWDRVDWEHLDRFIPENWTLETRVIAGIAALLMLLVVMRVVSIGWFLLRFYGYRLTRRNEALRISCGLLTRVSATVPIRRIQFVSVHQNLLMRWMRMASIRIETAGGAGKENEDAAATVARRWFVPSIPIDQVPDIVRHLHAELEWETDAWHWKPLAPRATQRMCRIAVYLSVLAGAAGFAAWQPWGWAVGVAVLPLFLFIAFKKSRSMKLARTDFGIAYRSGVWTRKTSVAFFEKIQAIRLDQNPFDRRWRMATLEIDTAAAGPADHRIDVRFLDEQFANEEFETIRHEVAIRKPRFA